MNMKQIGFLTVGALACVIISYLVVQRNKGYAARKIKEIAPNGKVISGVILDNGKKDYQGFRHMEYMYIYKGKNFIKSDLRTIYCDQIQDGNKKSAPQVYVYIDSITPSNSLVLLTEGDFKLARLEVFPGCCLPDDVICN